ncbi:MAG: restriction endonuclease [Candidatus Accumulibacter sp.]|jgi:hypothetical protein|nr:restriction endonuclease [Accumulibacter sp.]
MQGQLFTQDFLLRGIFETPPHEALSEDDLTRFGAALQEIFAGISAESTINEAQTEQLIIEKTLVALGWGDDYLPQVNLSGKRREDVPDVLLFPDAAAKEKALKENRDDRRYQYGIALLEAKRWLRPLDRGDAAEALDPGAPSSQMLRYLSRADLVSGGKVKWGLLTNGALWRLYWQDARSRSEEFFEIDLAQTLGVAGAQRELDAPDPQHALRLFHLFFSRAAFLPQEWDTARRSFHAYARNEAKLYEEKVSQDLGARVFHDIFPRLAEALAVDDQRKQTQRCGIGPTARPQYTRAYLEELREATLILLYRLLFLFYAEDRNLLPVRDERYAAYSVRRLREQIRDDVDAQKAFSSRLALLWNKLRGVFQLLDEGDDLIGMPGYNGGLFDRDRAPLLERTRVPDAVLAPILDALSRRTEDLLRAWINYRDLSVAHLGGIYERLLDYTLEHEVQGRDNFGQQEINRIVARPASFARKTSGSYYTHDDLVRLLLKESVGRCADEARQRFAERIKKQKNKAAFNPADWDALDKLDPASAMIELTVCDPAMGSGHFLVALVDTLADLVLEAINAAGHLVGEQKWAAHLLEQNRPWQSPLVARIAHIRQSIQATAREHGWSIADAQLDDRHIVRRVILKKNVFGVDKNPMAVELAKTALWLHTFTVGAPLSFLDHHLCCGDSLHGETLEKLKKELLVFGSLFQESELSRLEIAAQSLVAVGALTDSDISEVERSKELSHEAAEQLAPIAALLDFWRALRWIVPGWPSVSSKRCDAVEADKAALAELLSGRYNLVQCVFAGQIEGKGETVKAANDLLARVKMLARRENFFHWQTYFPDVFCGKNPGFDIVIGNPPWDRIKLQEVEWFSGRDPEIARQARAADRKALIAELEKKRAHLWRAYQEATERAEANARVLTKGGDFPLLSGGDVNLYSLFVERAQSLIKPEGLVALLTPSGIAADLGAAPFFRRISGGGRLAVLFDFENRQNPDGSYFPDVDSRFKFCTLVFGGVKRKFTTARCAFYLHNLDELEEEGVPEAECRVLELSAEDFKRVNPNTGTAPIFKSRCDADIVMRIYRNHPVLIDRSGKGKSEKSVWPVKYVRMFDMTNDSGLFKTRAELEAEGFTPAALNRWKNRDAETVPLYEGKMVQMYDHRAADVVMNYNNLKRAAQQEDIDVSHKQQTDRYPVPQYWIDRLQTQNVYTGEWAIAFKSITSPTNMRTMIGAILPQCGVGNSMAMLLPSGDLKAYASWGALFMANLASFAFDFVLRQKVQGQNLNWFILEQLPVIAPAAFEEKIAGIKIADFIREQVLRLSYTAHDLAPFARDLGFVGEPFPWDEEERQERMAALDALFFHLYGLSREDARHILASFPIAREQDIAACGAYRTQNRILAALEKLESGQWPLILTGVLPGRLPEC